MQFNACVRNVQINVHKKTHKNIADLTNAEEKNLGINEQTIPPYIADK